MVRESPKKNRGDQKFGVASYRGMLRDEARYCAAAHRLESNRAIAVFPAPAGPLNLRRLDVREASPIDVTNNGLAGIWVTY